MKPPNDLSRAAKSIWTRLHRDFELTDAAAVEILTAGLRAFDVCARADAQLATDGLTVTDRYGAPKVHPLVDVARSARGQWLQALRMLGLNEPAGENAR